MSFRIGLAVVIAAASLIETAVAAEPASPSQVVLGFFHAYATFHPSDGIPDAAGRARYAPYISPSLERLLADGATAEEAFAKANKDSPPLIEGDLFTSNFEGATRFEVQTCREDARTAACKTALTYDPGPTGNPKDKPITWTDIADLIETPSGWRVDDIEYGASWAFGNKGRLRHTLELAITDAGR